MSSSRLRTRGRARPCEAIRGLPGIVRADALFGGPPVIAIVELPMVTDTETHVVRVIGEPDR